jgi:hypothetical protein
MTTYVVAHSHRLLTTKEQIREHHGNTMESLPALPDPTERHCHVSYYAGRRVTMPGFSGGHVWGPLADAAQYPTRAEARRAMRDMRGNRIIVDLADATEYERQRHLARVRAKAKRVGR